MDFIDRQEELKRLRRLSTNRNGGFAVLYGRRRIGKSYLLTKWCSENDGLYTVGDTSSSSLQRQTIAGMIASRFPGFDEVIYPNWHALLHTLSLRARTAGWHGPFIMDEFPYLVTSDDTLPSVLQSWIDSEIRQNGLLVIISGSSQHMMQGLTLHKSSPLYGRAQEILPLAPLAAGYIQEALNLTTCLDALKAYFIWGGVPRYWQSAEAYSDDIDNCLDDLVFSPLGLYHEEPNYLLQSEIPSAISLRPYLEAIGYGAHRISEIASRLQQQTTAMSRPMARLVELGLVKKEVPFGESERNSKKSLYSIADPFCHFWFQIVAPRRSFFDQSPKNARLLAWGKYANAIYAYQWEQLARKTLHHARLINSLLKDDDCWLPAKRWWQENQPEWDIVSTNFAGDIALLGEVKWSQHPFNQSEVNQLSQELLKRKYPPQLPAKAIRVLILPTIEDNVQTPDGIYMLTAEDILQASLQV